MLTMRAGRGKDDVCQTRLDYVYRLEVKSSEFRWLKQSYQFHCVHV